MLPLWNDDATGVRVVRLIGSHEEEELIEVFEEIAEAEGWEPGTALRRWQHRSVYFALQVQGRIVGGLQLVLPDASGMLPCQTVWPDVKISNFGRCAHVAILAVEEAYRGHEMHFWRVVVETWRHCVGTGIATLFIEVTPRVLCIYKRLGWPLLIEADRRMHWGEECFLCSLGIPEVAERLLRRAERSPYYRRIVAQAFRVTLPANTVGRGDVVREHTVQAYAA